MDDKINENNAMGTESRYLVYVTCSDRSEARAIARAMVEQRLAACANILGECESTYLWQGNVETSTEVSMLLKTSGHALDNLIDGVKNIHSYECPCIICVKIDAGNKEFLSWMGEMTS